METQKIQATITLTLTPEQLLTLLNAAPQNAQPTPAPAPMPQAQPIAAAPTPAQMFAQPMQTAPMQTANPAMYTTPAPTAAPIPPAQPTAPTVAAPVPASAPIPQAQPTPAPMPTQTAPQTYSVTDLGLAARPLMEGGRQQELIALLTEFGVQSVAAIPEDRRADFAARLRALGGQI